ncbi:MAG: MarR family winged helix-turn-helix transcriptional regulator [Opitutales bacterium]
MPAAVRVTPADYATLAEFRHALRLFQHFSAEAARRSGLSPGQHQALVALKGFGDDAGQTVGEIARRLLLQPHSAVGLVDRLAQGGLVRRRPDAGDRRRVRVTLTPKGERVLERLAAIHREELRRLRPALQELLQRIG